MKMRTKARYQPLPTKRSHAVQKQKSLSCAAPIEIVELHLVDGDESRFFVRRLIRPIRLRVYRKGDHQQYCRPPILYLLRSHAIPRDAWTQAEPRRASDVNRERGPDTGAATFNDEPPQASSGSS